MLQCDANLPCFCLCARQCRLGDDSDVSASAERMPALLRRASALECLRMFEARFQSFDDSSERAHSASRVAALRAELKRRGLDGFLVPRADRQQNEYLPASRRAARLAHRLHRLGRFRDRAGRARRTVRGRALHGAGGRADRQGGLCHRTSGRQPARSVARAKRKKRVEDRLRSLAAHDRGRRQTQEGLRGGRRRIGRRRRQSDRRALARAPGATQRRGEPARRQARRRKRGRQAQAHPGGALEAARRCAGGVEPAKRRLGL